MFMYIFSTRTSSQHWAGAKEIACKTERAKR